jgi:hypothetical protein
MAKPVENILYFLNQYIIYSLFLHYDLIYPSKKRLYNI